MKTDDWIALLARDAGPARPHAVLRRLGLGAGAGLAACALAVLLLAGPNPALFATGAPGALKLGYVLALTAAALVLADRAVRPGTPLRRGRLAVLGVLGLMAVPALISWCLVPPTERWAWLMGGSWRVCPMAIAALAALAWPAVAWAMKGLAPTRLRWAGFAAGLLCGCLGALGYLLYCSELSPLFVWVWYSLGMLVPALLGAWAGPRWLRW